MEFTADPEGNWRYNLKILLSDLSQIFFETPGAYLELDDGELASRLEVWTGNFAR